MATGSNAPLRQAALDALQLNSQTAAVTPAFDALWPDTAEIPAWLRPLLHKVYADGAQQGNSDAHADVEAMTNPYAEATSNEADDKR